MKTKMKRAVVTLAVAIGALTVGSVGGAAVAQVPTLWTPWGVSTDSENAQKMEAPDYERNGGGLTYGSAADAPTPDLEPDLIEAQATNGASGFVRKAELDKANGSDAVDTFKSPQDALTWQSAQSKAPILVPVYDVSGQKVIGEFLVTRNG